MSNVMINQRRGGGQTRENGIGFVPGLDHGFYALPAGRNGFIHAGLYAGF